MICQFDAEIHKWVAAGRGPLRPIVVEAEEISEALTGFYEARQAQEHEEYAMFEAMSGLALEREGNVEDLG